MVKAVDLIWISGLLVSYFGGLWAGCAIVLLALFRFLPGSRPEKESDSSPSGSHGQILSWSSVFPAVLMMAGAISAVSHAWNSALNNFVPLIAGLAGTVLLPALAWSAGASLANRRGTSHRSVRLALMGVCLPASLSSIAEWAGLPGLDPASVLSLGLMGPAPIPANSAAAISLFGLTASLSAGGRVAAAMAVLHLGGVIAGGSRAAGLALGIMASMAGFAALARSRGLEGKLQVPASGNTRTLFASALLFLFGLTAVWHGRADFTKALPANFVALDLRTPAFSAEKIKTEGGGVFRVTAHEAAGLGASGSPAADCLTVTLRPSGGKALVSGVSFAVSNELGRRSARVAALLKGNVVFRGDYFGCRGTGGPESRMGLFFAPLEADAVTVGFFPPHRTDLFQVSDLSLLGAADSSPAGLSLHPALHRVGVDSLDCLIGRFRAQIFRLLRADFFTWRLPSCFGVGPGKASEYFHSRPWVFQGEGMPLPRHAHNLLLQFWLEMGWAGACAALMLVAISLKAVRRSLSRFAGESGTPAGVIPHMNEADSFAVNFPAAGCLAAAFLTMNLLDFVILTKSCAAITLFFLAFETARR